MARALKGEECQGAGGFGGMGMRERGRREEFFGTFMGLPVSTRVGKGEGSAVWASGEEAAERAK